MPHQTVVKTYQGRERDAMEQFRRDAGEMAAQGYQPVSQTYAAGSYGCASFLVALALCVIVIGIVVFVYMLVVKPAGTLTVTYAKFNQQTDDRGASKSCPECAETVEAAALKCRFCGFVFPGPAFAQSRAFEIIEPHTAQRAHSGSYSVGRQLGQLWAKKSFRMATYVIVGLYVLGAAGSMVTSKTDSTELAASSAPILTTTAAPASTPIVATKVAESKDTAYTDEQIADLIKMSQDFKKHRSGYIKAVRSTLDAGKCTIAHLKYDGFWLKSQQHIGAPVYFLHCGESHRDYRVYIDVVKGTWFQ